MLVLNPFTESEPSAIRSRAAFIDWAIQAGSAARQYVSVGSRTRTYLHRADICNCNYVRVCDDDHSIEQQRVRRVGADQQARAASTASQRVRHWRACANLLPAHSRPASRTPDHRMPATSMDHRTMSRIDLMMAAMLAANAGILPWRRLGHWLFVGLPLHHDASVPRGQGHRGIGRLPPCTRGQVPCCS